MYKFYVTQVSKDLKDLEEYEDKLSKNSFNENLNTEPCKQDIEFQSLDEFMSFYNNCITNIPNCVGLLITHNSITKTNTIIICDDYIE